MCSVNPTIPLLGTEKEVVHVTKNANKSEDIVCLGTPNVEKLVNTVKNNCTVKRKREADTSIEIVCEINSKKSKLQQNTISGGKKKNRKSNLLNTCMPRVTSAQQEMRTINSDDSILICEIDDDDDVIVVDDLSTVPIVSARTETVPNLIPHYNNSLLDFIPLENSKSNVIMPNINVQCTNSKTRKRISKRCKRNVKVLIGAKVHSQSPSTATSGIQENPSSTSSPASEFGNNFYNPHHKNIKKSGLRPIIIDGSNVAMG